MFVACAATVCAALSLGDTSLSGFLTLVAAGSASLLALVAALLNPRQIVLASFAAALTLIHAGLWVWILIIHFAGL